LKCKFIELELRWWIVYKSICSGNVCEQSIQPHLVHNSQQAVVKEKKTAGISWSL